MGAFPLDPLIILILAFLGIPVGSIIALQAAEEMEKAKPIFFIIRILLIPLAFLFFLLSFHLHIIVVLLLTIIAYSLLLLIESPVLGYLLPPVILGLSTGNILLLELESGLVFLISMVQGILVFEKKNFIKKSFLFYLAVLGISVLIYYGLG